MADTPFTFRLVTPQRLLMEAEVTSLQVPGSEGYLGVLAHHAPLITALRPGRLDVRDAKGAMQSYAVSGGFLEVSNNRATVLADTAERKDEIDVARAEACVKRAEERLRADSGSAHGGGTATATVIDKERAQRALERAKNRLHVARG
ncbi:MAG TPA: ATP synthase F1 subunit epsilon [Candidatus Eisenbacteria bacterium]|nr:ATP synthase F1 subunit epsilon [Candidatus Eisenbacteria bacterium]